ncbi:DUF551 domain-containing protein [Klebsiella pneumoniae]
MTSKLTRERLEELAAGQSGFNLRIATLEESQELARMALAAIDGEQVAQCPYPCGWDTLNKLAIQDAAFVALSLVAGEPATESIRQAAITNSDRLLKVISACRAAMLAAAPQLPSSEPATVPGKWIPVSERMPESNGVYFGWDGKRVLEVNCFFGGFSANQFIHGEITHWMPLPAPPTEVS